MVVARQVKTPGQRLRISPGDCCAACCSSRRIAGSQRTLEEMLQCEQVTEMTATDAASITSLAERVATKLVGLSPAESRVAAFISDHADDVAFLSVNDLARQLQTSDATVVRTAQALGYAGFPDLRGELIDAVRNQVSPALRLGRGLESLGDTSAALLDRSIEAQ